MSSDKKPPYQQIIDTKLQQDKENGSSFKYNKNILPKSSSFAPVKKTKIKIALTKDSKISVKPSNKIVSTILSKLQGSAYNLKENEWFFDLIHYDFVTAEFIKNNLEFEKIPKGTLFLAKKSISNDTFPLNAPIFDMLLPFQRQAVQFALNRNGRVLLADDMGLGKTIQSLAIAYFYRLEFPLLIISPASLLCSWSDSVKQFLNEDAVIIREKSDFGAKISVISYNLTTNFIDVIKTINYGVIICDECHYLKSITSKRTKSLLPILQKVSRLILLSGTPATSRPLELYPIIAALDHTIYSTFTAYGNRYCNGRKIGNFYDYRGCSNAEELAIVLERAFMIRRLKDNILNELPKKFRRQIILEIPGVKQFKKQVNFQGDEIESSIITEFVNAASIKKDAVIKYIENMLEKNIKTLVFAHHQEMLDALEAFCKEKKQEYIRIDGSVQSGKRHALIESFQNSDQVRIAILSLTACATGLTLTAGKAVVFAELYWNPGTLLQAEDRIHRIGQQDNVDIHYLVAKGTVDDMVWPHILKKLNVLEKLGVGKNDLKSVKGVNENAKIQLSISDFLEKQ